MSWGDPLSVWRKAYKVWYYGAGEDEDPCTQNHYYDEFEYPPDSATGNYTFVSANANTDAQFQSTAEVSFQGAVFGLPELLTRVPDGTEILEAWAEVNCTGLTRTHYQSTAGVYDCSGAEVTPPTEDSNTTIENVIFTVLAFTGPNDFESIGSITGAPGQRVVDVTSIVQAMMARRMECAYGFGLIAADYTLSQGSIMGMVPPEGPTRTREACPGEMCPGTRIEYYTTQSTTVSWSNLSFGRFAVKVDYPEAEKQRMLLMPMWPDMGPAV